VYFPASDDYILPGFIEKSMAMLDRHPEAGLCCSYHSTIDGITGAIRVNPSRWCDRPRYFTPKEAEELFTRGNVVGHTAILKREAVAAAGGYLPDLEWHSDLFVGQVVGFRHGLCHIPEMLALLTVLPGTYSSEAGRDERQIRIIGSFLDRLMSPEYADVAFSFYQSGCLGIFGGQLVRAASRRPDAWSKDILGFLSCLEIEQYEELVNDPDSAVNELARFFAGPNRSPVKMRIKEYQDRIKHLEERSVNQHKVIEDLCGRIQLLDSTVEKSSHRIASMEASVFWQVRTFLARCRRAIFGMHKPLRADRS
jgi:uncharacterized coiled-coil protein SlyX